ncbi:M4 family metallopeptidase [Providencia alcalifaciens]|uniref:M4 family metallopeptidase n=1 Tax=Providencia alcalifaciens TaxID=126385 RepID=UPI001CE0F9A4|nr:M4 family metallopeptidase [Providencia alcalifaciens]UBX49172.1 M4 family metallopeptidase [Providencia alcalifaciens]
MNQILGRSLLSPSLISHFYQESQCNDLKSTLFHINDIMSRTYTEEDASYQRQLLANACNITGGTYNRVIRDAQQRVENYTHNHSSLPICRREEMPADEHMAHNDFAVIMREEDKVAPTVPAHRVFDAIGLIRSFLKEKLNIDQMFGCDADINAVIHYDKNYSNAFWNSQAIFFGDGDGTVFGPFYNDIDIIAHELAHGYISSQADFNYVNQSGALNESVADVLGMMTKQYVQKQTVQQSNWLLGENLFIDKKKGPALRSMKEPGTAYYFTKSNNDPQVGHMQQYRDLPRYVDNGGVHINSGIPNKAFYLLATRLGGYSWEVAGKIWVAAVSDPNVSNTATFIEFAQATIRSAKNLFGDQIELATRQSWLDVGLRVQ